jgi:hypothetical protein
MHFEIPMLAPAWDSLFPTFSDTDTLFYWWRLSKGTTLPHIELWTTCTKKMNGKGFHVPKRSKHSHWYAGSSTASQEIPCILWDWKIHQHTYNTLPLVCIMSDESKYNLPPYFLKNLQSTLVFKTNLFFQMFQPKPRMCFVSLSYVPHAQHINIWMQLSVYCVERQQSYNDLCVTNISEI